MKKIKPTEILEDANLRKIITYPPELEVDLFKAKLAVQSPYQLAKINGEPYIIASWIAKYKEEGKKSEEFNWDEVVTKYINPFKEENLLKDFAKINIQDQESILNFCNNYGLLGEKVNKIAVEESGIDTFANKVVANYKESLKYFIKETKSLRGLLILYHHLIQPLKNNKSIDTNEDLKLTLKGLQLNLIQGINEKLGLIRQAATPGENGELLPGFTTSSLLGAIYQQLYETVTQGKQFKVCLKCGSLFVPRKANVKYCPPLHGEQHGACENSYNQMKRRGRQDVKSGKKTIEEVANSLGRPLYEVRGWFN